MAKSAIMPLESKNDGDLRKFLSITYKTAQVGIGGNFQNFFLSPFARHNTDDF
jgi:hypothetical protein